MIQSATELVEGYRNKALSPVEATVAALDAIEAYDGRVNAFVLVDREGAMAAAKESEARWHAGEPLGPGDGVPTSIKDALWTRGWPTGTGTTGAIVDLALFYGRNNLLINGDQGWVPGNVFGAIVEGLDEMAAACQDLWMGGVRGETLSFSRHD
jgi:hypothetical protein